MCRFGWAIGQWDNGYVAPKRSRGGWDRNEPVFRDGAVALGWTCHQHARDSPIMTHLLGRSNSTTQTTNPLNALPMPSD